MNRLADVMIRNVVVLLFLLLPSEVVAQSGSVTGGLFTPWGTPDFRGVWVNSTLTPLERQPELGDKEFYTEAELEELQSTAFQRWRTTPDIERQLAVESSPVWLEPGPLSRRTSLITGLSGRIPPLTPDGERRKIENGGVIGTRFLTERVGSHEDRPWSERCLVFETGGPPMMAFPIAAYHQIFQTPGHVVFLHEENHDVRIVPLERRPHVNPDIRLWRGDSRGYWDGNTLVIETTNFNGKGGFSGSGSNLLLTERLTLADDETLLYEFTVLDPETWTEPWTVEMPLWASSNQLYEHACHEGNYSLPLVLSGARAQEQKR